MAFHADGSGAPIVGKGLPTYRKVAKWGNSLAVRLPSDVVKALRLKENDNVELHVEGTRSLAVQKQPAAKDVLARLRKLRGRLPKGFRFDRLEANER